MGNANCTHAMLETVFLYRAQEPITQSLHLPYKLVEFLLCLAVVLVAASFLASEFDDGGVGTLEENFHIYAHPCAILYISFLL